MNAKFNQACKAIGVAATSAAVTAMACPAFAFASDAQGIAVILPDARETIPMLVAFLILCVVLYKFGWPLLDGILVRRENQIKDDLKAAEDARIESERILAEYKQQIAEAKAEANQIVAEAKKAADGYEAERKAVAQKEAEDMIERARTAIELEKKSAIAELQGSIADISTNVAAKLIGTDLTDDEHRAIIKRYVEEAGSFNAN